MIANLDDAGRDIAAMLRILEAKMRAKGWESADCHLSIYSSGSPSIMLHASRDMSAPAFLDPLGARIGYAFGYGDTIGEAIADAERKIALMLDHPTEAIAPWFVEQEKVAAE